MLVLLRDCTLNTSRTITLPLGYKIYENILLDVEMVKQLSESEFNYPYTGSKN